MHAHKLRNTLIITIVSIISLVLTMHLSLFIDESFTMSLIRHSYRSIISLDAMDIHPPLYYLILKLFLYIVTLGHQRIITYVILARLFSFACVFLSFIVAWLTLRSMKLRCNAGILYTLLMLLMLYIQEVASIRMYPLTTLFVMVEFYGLVNFIYHQQNHYLWIVTIFAILAAYTHDYAAVIAGLFILLPFIHAVVHHTHTAINWLISGVIFLIAYLPWLKVSIDQALNLPSHYWILMINSLRDSLLFITLLLFSYPVLKVMKRVNPQNQFIYRLVLNVSIIMLILELILTIHQPVFILRYICPLLFIYITVTYGLLANQYQAKTKSGYTMLFTCLFLFILGLNAFYINDQYQKQFHYQTVQLNQVFNEPQKRLHFNIKKVTQGNIRHLCQFNTYAQYRHKALSLRENQALYNNFKLKQGTNVKLMKKLWTTQH